MVQSDAVPAAAPVTGIEPITPRIETSQLPTAAGTSRRSSRVRLAAGHTVTLPRIFSRRPGPDPVDFGELIDGCEGAVGLPPGDDRGGGHRTHPGQSVQLGVGGGVEIDQSPGRFGCGRRGMIPGGAAVPGVAPEPSTGTTALRIWTPPAGSAKPTRI